MPQTDPPDALTRRRRREVGERVRSLRRSRKVAQDALANQAGMQRSTLQRIEYGQTAASIDRLWAIADVLKVPVTWLLSDDWRQPTDEDGAHPSATDVAKKPPAAP